MPLFISRALGSSLRLAAARSRICSLSLLSRSKGGVTGHKRGSRCVHTHVPRADIRVVVDHIYVIDGNAKHFSHDLRYDGIRTLSDLG